MSEPAEIFQIVLDEKGKEEVFSIRALQKFGSATAYLTSDKIGELWQECSQHDTLFSDYTRGKVEPFLDVLFDPRSIINEIYKVSEEIPVGLMMLSQVIPRFDALGHFTFWDSYGRGRESILTQMMSIWMDEFDLHRVSVHVPGHQTGVIRIVKRLGFSEEGVKKEGLIHRGSWVDMIMFGLLRSDLQENENG